MKAVILAGGFGTRLAEETSLRPKPMVEIGGMPILWHIMKMYSSHGVNEFVICCGYKQYFIKEYFANYLNHVADVTIRLRENSRQIHETRAEDWTITLVDTGLDTMTGGRINRILPYVKDEEAFCLTYGDGVSDIDIGKSIEFHKSHGKLATVSAVFPEARFGALDIQGNQVHGFQEKPIGDGGRINGGFFVLNPSLIEKYITEGDPTVWEQQPLVNLARDGELMAFEHDGFWQPMDTLRDKEKLEKLWADGTAPWKSWS